MNKGNKQKVEIEIRGSINTDSIEQNFYQFGDSQAPHINNTGIERDGGITNIYEKETALSAGNNIITEDGKVLNFNAGVITLDGKTIANVSPYGVSTDLEIKGVDDCFITASSYVTCSLVSNTITIKEYDFTNTLLNSRSVTFTNLSNVLTFFTSLSFVRYNGMAYADSQEWALRLGAQVLILKESTPAQTISYSFGSTDALGGATVVGNIVYNGRLVIGSNNGRIASFDGVNWTNYNAGVGLCNNQTVIGTQSAQIFAVYNNILVVAGGAGTRIGSWNGSSWTNYNAGSGLCNDNTVLGGVAILSMAVYGTSLAVGGQSGRIGSWNGSAWVNYNAGAGLCNNGTVVSTDVVSAMEVYGTNLVVGGSNGKIGSWTGAAWVNYNAGAGLCNNATVLGATLISMVTYGTFLVVGGVSGRIGSWNGSAWTNYNAGAGLCNNGTVVSTDAISALGVYGTSLVVGSGNGKIGSWNGSAWTNYNAGSGLCNNATIIGANTIARFTVYNNQLIVAGYNIINAINADGSFTPYYIEGATPISNLLTGATNTSYLYVYRYENGLYLINLVGDSRGKSYTLNDSTKAVVTLKCRYAIPQVSSGKTRHIVTSTNITGNELYDATNIKATGLVGYTDFITHSASVVYPTAVYTLGNGFVLQSQAGFGYCEFTWRNNVSATNVFNYLPQFSPTVTNLYQIVQQNTNTLLNAYGKLNNNYLLPSTKPFEFRVNWINGTQSYLSVATVDTVQTDAMGVLLTNVGEFDDTYTPMIIGDDTILYRYNNIFYLKKISSTVTNRISQIDRYLYKINTISPLNILDTSNFSMDIGSSDFNNRMYFVNTAAPATVSTKVNSLFKRTYSNSIDTGDKLVTITSLSSSNIELIGYRVTGIGLVNEKFVIDTYIDDVYSFSTFADGSELVDVAKTGTLYIPDTLLPVQIGANYSNGTAQTVSKTLLLSELYDGYLIGNEIEGQYTLFTLFGQQYAFDGKLIYLVGFNNGVFLGLTKLCSAYGMQYIASSPTLIYFYSDFDNSLYTFDGGRTLTKSKRLNALPAFVKGIYSVKDNTLLFETSTSLVWLRDNVWTQNTKKASQTSLKLYSTTEGIQIANDSYSWQYHYTATSGYSLVTLNWKSAFFTQGMNEKSILSEMVYTIFSSSKEAMTVLGKIYTVDESDNYETQEIRWDLQPYDFSSAGYCRLRVQPEAYRPLAIAFELEFNAKVVLHEVIAEFSDSSRAVIAQDKSV